MRKKFVAAPWPWSPRWHFRGYPVSAEETKTETDDVITCVDDVGRR
jgi:hypothetical protein